MYDFAGATLTVTDLSRSVDFYTGTLGFSISRSAPGQWAEVTFAGFSLFLLTRRAGQPPAHGIAGVTLVVRDLERRKEVLEARGVMFIGDVVDAETVRVAICEDPDANPIYLVEQRDDHPTLPIVISLSKGATA